ncbi:MAG: tRNA adenosine(34) deaminase TadA [Planctomycetota bacterium]|nr:tRNA adenosine(34) deaminase TadA [Planctomycetota bacterium]MDA1142756.1 tRNA adenosine(34) deaminase TadA [Planctomycetota bacterium]
MQPDSPPHPLPLSIHSDEYFMGQALREAEFAFEEDEVPVGAVIVFENRIIGRAHNQREQLNDPTAHAEILALTQASAELESWRLNGTTMYVTLEPCPMCAGALVNARVDRLVFGCADPKAGACGTLWNLVQSDKLNHRLQTDRDLMEQECRDILQRFFRMKRT